MSQISIINTISKIKVKELVTSTVVAISIAALYYALTMMTPEVSMTYYNHSTIQFRLSNSLRILSLWSPIGVIGCVLGGYTTNMHSGLAILTPLTYLMLTVQFTMLTIANKVSKIIGRSLMKDILLVSTATIITSLFVQIDHAGADGVFNISKILARTLKSVPSGIITTIIGYPLLRVVEGFSDKLRK